jgi:hypothetical protein
MTISSLSLDEAMQISEQLSPADQLRLIGLLSERLRQRIEAEDEPVDMLTLPPTLPSADFWQGSDIQDLAEQQNVQPVTDFEALLGGWPDDEPLDDFLTTVREWRQQNLAEVVVK